MGMTKTKVDRRNKEQRESCRPEHSFGSELKEVRSHYNDLFRKPESNKVVSNTNFQTENTISGQRQIPLIPYGVYGLVNRGFMARPIKSTALSQSLRPGSGIINWMYLFKIYYIRGHPLVLGVFK